MYLDYFGLSEAPFSITPDPGFVYLSRRHRDALAHLLYGVGQGGSCGFVQLTGEVGTGKTTLCRCLLEQVPAGTRIALVLNPLLSPLEMLQSICEELRIDISGVEDSSKALVDRLNAFLLQAHRDGERVVLVIDEAQNLSQESLEQIRLLTNLETSKDKLLQIILLGQPELRELLQRRNLRQLAQRITARYHLTPLGPDDSAAYVSHRLQVAGAARNPFKRSALKALYQRSQGVPRLINIIADRALTGAYAAERQRVDARMVHAAADEVQLGEPGVRRSRGPWLVAAAVLAAALAAWLLLPGDWRLRFGQQPPPSVVNIPAPEVAPAEDEVQAPEPVPAAIEEPAAVEALDLAWLDGQHLRAWSGLATAWGASQDADLVGLACQEGRAGLGYACLRDQGNWARIERLGLPVVLVLQTPDTRHLLLSGMEGAKLWLGGPDDGRELTRTAVDSWWLGSFYVAWPQSPGWPVTVAPGDSGPAVEALFEMAARVDPPYTGAAVFAAEFESWLRTFQVRNGLEPDGIVGPRTLLYLMRHSITEPSLARHAAGES